MQLSMQKLLQGYLLISIMQRLKYDMWCALLHAHGWGSCFHSPLANWRVNFQECIAHLTARLLPDTVTLSCLGFSSFLCGSAILRGL